MQQTLDLAITILFILELGIKGFVAHSRGQFLREYWVDTLAVLPMLRPSLFSRILRPGRLLFGRRVSLFHVILREGASHTVVFACLMLAVVLFAMLGIMVIENEGDGARGP